MGITGKGKISSSNDIDSGEYTAPESKGSLGFDFDTPSMGNPSNSIRDSITGSGPKAPKSSIGLGIGASPVGNLGLGLEIPLPVAAPVSARGGVSIDPTTGEIRGGYGGLGIGKGPIGASVDVGVDTPKGSEDFGCFKYVTFNVGPFSHTVSKNECEPKQKLPEKDSPSAPVADPNPNKFPLGWKCPDGTSYYLELQVPVNGAIQNMTFSEGIEKVRLNYEFDTKISSGASNEPYDPYTPERADANWGVDKWVVNTYRYVNWTAYHVYSTWRIRSSGSFFGQWVTTLQFEYTYEIYSDKTPFAINNQIGKYGKMYNFNVFLRKIEPYPNCFNGFSDPAVNDNFLGDNFPSISSPSLPNPLPIKKKMDNKCCKLLIQLQLETLRLLGRQLGPNGVMAQSKEKGFIGEEIERTLTPINNPNNPEKVKVRFTTVYQMLVYALRQGMDLDTALDPQSYKVPTGKLQNPAYSRDSEHSLKSNDQPNKDKSGNSRELEINKDDSVKMSGFLQQQSYMFKMLQRLEYLFPPGELQDALIAKNLLIPGAKGDIKIHNMIMAYEVQMQYLNAALGDPREILTIKDANPAIEGDQPLEVRSLSISDLLRQNIKFHIDTGGDVDALVNLVLRDFRTNLANRLDQIKTGEMVQALFEDSGMLEKQEYIDVHLEGDPYAGQWVKGQGFKANPDLEKKTEESTEKVLRETMKPTEQRVKVSRRHKDEKTDMRDLLRGLADFIQRLLSIPSAGDASKSIDQLVESAKFKIQTDMALLRQNVTQAAAASRNRTKKRKK